MSVPAGAEIPAAAPVLRATNHPWLRPDDLSIPMLPDQAQRVLQTVGDPEVTIAKLATVVTKDPVLATRVLGMANSALFGAMSPLRSVSDAVVRLGTRTVRNVVVTVSMQSQFKSPEVYGNEGARFMEHAVGTAYVAHLIAERLRSDVEEAFLCGLLHDIGKLVILKTAHQHQKRNNEIIPAEELRTAMADYHALCGALALGFWNVPDEVREVVRCHHAFEDASVPQAAAICYAANLLSHRYGFGCEALGDAVLEDGVFAYLDLDADWMATTDVRAPGLFSAARQALG
ncbi:MAG TPA: HDOD domain-containing protein [Luteitalea sp.]|nr:HDOD domain-containing protein [Luteitalea sp.]